MKSRADVYRDILSFPPDMYRDVLNFHQTFVPDTIGILPRMLPADMMEFRLKFLSEELLELAQAVGRSDREQAADALVDLVYVALGTAVMMGLPWDDLWVEVHQANMRKVRTESAQASKRGSIYDVVKPKGWEPPNIQAVIEQAFQRHHAG